MRQQDVHDGGRGEIVVTTLLIVHGLVAVALLGGITHQTAAACWPAQRQGSFVTSFRAVSAARCTTPIIVVYIAPVLMRGVIYPPYPLAVRPRLEHAQLAKCNCAVSVNADSVP